MMDKLSSFIDKVYKEPYSLAGNNCIHKSLKIRAKARELDKRADVILSLSVVPVRRLHNLRLANLHMYCLIDGKRVDVSLDPGHEAMYCRNREKKILAPLNISRLGRRLGSLVGVMPLARTQI
jgi:hypothetical protein